MQLFFLSEISVYLSQFLLLYITFLLMVLKQGTFHILPLTVFEIVKSQKEEKQRNIISGQFFSFSNFSGFWKYRNKLWHQLKQISLINYQNFWSYATFLLKFWHKSEKCRYNRDFVWHVSILAWTLSYRGLKKSYFTWQKNDINWKMSVTEKKLARF